MLLDAYTRCVNVINNSTKPTETAAQVCQHVTNCYTVAAQFPACREKMIGMPQLVKDLCRILYFKVKIIYNYFIFCTDKLFQHLTKLCWVATECVSALSVDSILQMELLKAGALWHLLLFMFHYDFTLDEGGVECSEEANQKEVSNRLAKQAVKACACLGGYSVGDESVPSNPVTKSILEALLTPYLADQLATNKPEEVSGRLFSQLHYVVVMSFVNQL